MVDSYAIALMEGHTHVVFQMGNSMGLILEARSPTLFFPSTCTSRSELHAVPHILLGSLVVGSLRDWLDQTSRVRAFETVKDWIVMVFM